MEKAREELIEKIMEIVRKLNEENLKLIIKFAKFLLSEQSKEAGQYE